MKYYSRGKLLISGEYLVLKGALALVLPLQKGHTLSLEKADGKGKLEWYSLQYGKEWFCATFDLTLFDILNASDKNVAFWLRKILSEARKLNSGFLNEDDSILVKTDLEFDKQWGFGSSSSLIANIARWAGVDQFTLHTNVSKGSGYDVVAASMNSPFFYTLIDQSYNTKEVNFNPEFKDRIYFIYLGQKQDSSKVVDQFLKRKKQFKVEIRTISELSQHLAKAKNLQDFEFYLREHDQLMASVLNQERLKDKRFKDLPGEIKPLGAWGGDFAMMTWNDAKTELKTYLNSKKINIVFGFDELIKTK